jgi:hypothetical protein
MVRILRNRVFLVLISLLSAELAVRVTGISPVPRPVPGTVNSRITKEESQLGWDNRPKAKQSFIVAGEPPHTITILENGARATSDWPTFAGNIHRRDIIFIGCSFTHGWGLNDEETFAWKVQAALPDWNVHNFGVNGYGTCQAYILLKRLFEQKKWYKPVVIYGFIDYHEQRNVAHFLWHHALSRLTSTGNVSLPSCMLDSSGSIVFNSPRPYPQFPFRHTLAVVSLFEKVYLRLQGSSLANQSQAITEQLLIELEAFTTAQSGHFGVLLFNGQARTSHYRQFLESRGSRIIDTNFSDQNFGPLTFFDGHPNSRMTDLVAQNVVTFVRSLRD